MTDLEREILDILSMDPETAEMLTKMVELEDGSSPYLDDVNETLRDLWDRGLVRPNEGWGSDLDGEPILDYWWTLTEEGRAQVPSNH